MKNKNSVLFIIGTGDLKDKIMHKINSLECRHNIKLLGVRNDVSGIMQGLDVLLLPSFVEGFPVVAVEAQAAGLPLFVSEDAVTKQVQLTKGIHFLPLSLGADKWANIINNTNIQRYDGASKLKEKGFDTRDAAKHIIDRFRC